MKRIFSSLIAILFLLVALGAKAQTTWPAPTPMAVLGNSNSPAMDTNSFIVRIKQLSATLSGMTNSLGVTTNNVFLSTSATSVSGALLVGQFTTSGSNNLSTNFLAYSTNTPLYTILQAQTGTNTVLYLFNYGP